MRRPQAAFLASACSTWKAAASAQWLWSSALRHIDTEMLEDGEAETGRNVCRFESKRILLHMAEDPSPCTANSFFSPLGNPGLSLLQGDPAALQLQTKGVTCFACRLEPNGGRRKRLIGFLQLLLFFLLQSERRRGDPSALGWGHCWGWLRVSWCCRHRWLWDN